MDEKQLYEQIGRLTIALAEANDKVTQCCGVIHGLKTGAINPDRLVTTETSFNLLPVETVEDVLKAHE